MFTNEVMDEQIIAMYSRESGMKRDFIHVHEWWKKATVYRLLYKAGEQKPYAGERLHMVGLYPSPAHRPLRGPLRGVPGK